MPVVSAPQPAEATTTITTIAAERGSPLLLGGRDFAWAGDHRACAIRGTDWEYRDLALGLIGQHQVENAAVATAVVETLRRTMAVDIQEAALRDGLADVCWPARLEVLQAGPGCATVVCDGAHNGASAQRLAEAIRAFFPHRRLYLIVGSLVDKDLAAMLAALAPLQPTIVWATASSHPRAQSASEVAAQAYAAGLAAETAPSVAEAMGEAMQKAQADDLVLATGSLSVAAEARAACGRTALDGEGLTFLMQHPAIPLMLGGVAHGDGPPGGRAPPPAPG